MKKNRKSKLTEVECRQSVLKFFEEQKRFKQIQSEFTETKEQFNNIMSDYFECNDVEKSMTFSYPNSLGQSVGDLVVNRIQKSSVIFDADKLEKVLDNEISKRVILKHYEIIDMTGLIAYLKSCGVDPKIFKSFLSVSKSVDTSELDRLEELGKITAEQVQGCYTVKRQKPYFTVGVVRGRGDND